MDPTALWIQTVLTDIHRRRRRCCLNIPLAGKGYIVEHKVAWSSSDVRTVFGFS